MTSLTRQIVRELELQAMTAQELAFMLDHPLGSVRSTIFELRELGYVATIKKGHTAFYELTPTAPSWAEMLDRKPSKPRKDKKVKAERIVVPKAPSVTVRALASRPILQTIWGGA